MEFDEVVTSDLKKIESKLEKYDEDFFVRKSKGAKKTATKTQVGALSELDMLKLLSRSWDGEFLTMEQFFWSVFRRILQLRRRWR